MLIYIQICEKFIYLKTVGNREYTDNQDNILRFNQKKDQKLGQICINKIA